MRPEMKRYNQGFGKFGPMEQCEDGEWVRFEDADAELEIQEEVCYERFLNEYLAELRATDYMIIAYMFGAIAVIEFILLVFR